MYLLLDKLIRKKDGWRNSKKNVLRGNICAILFISTLKRDVEKWLRSFTWPRDLNDLRTNCSRTTSTLTSNEFRQILKYNRFYKQHNKDETFFRQLDFTKPACGVSWCCWGNTRKMFHLKIKPNRISNIFLLLFATKISYHHITYEEFVQKEKENYQKNVIGNSIFLTRFSCSHTIRIDKTILLILRILYCNIVYKAT